MSRKRLGTPRERVLGVLMLGMLAIFALRLVQLQVFEHAQWKAIARGQSLMTRYQKPSRGEIHDRNGLALAVTLPLTYAIGYRPRYVVNFANVAGTLSTLLQKSKREVQEKLQTPGFTYLARRIDWQTKEKIEALKLSCFQYDEEPRRAYPSAGTAAVVVGFANVDGKGQEGVEASMDDELSGEGYQELCRVDALRKTEAAISPIPDECRGADVTLALDLQLQTIVEEAMRDGLKDRTYERACAIMVDPHTGDVLAMATLPSFDPNHPGDFKPEYRKCWPVTDVVKPGSVMKVVPVAKALESGKLSRTSLIDCERGSWAVRGAVIHDSHPHGTLSLDDIIALSSNIGAAKVSQRFSPAEVYDKLRAFGFGNKTLVEIAGEQAGYVPPPSTWSGPTQATLAFGQGISCTPLQLTMAYAAIANGGQLLKPRLVRSVDFISGVHTDYPVEAIRRVIPATIASALTEMLVGVVDHGTATIVKVQDVTIAGKTGTAEKVDHEHNTYFSNRYIASFIGFFPAENPRSVLLVMIDDPRGEHFGGSVAGPIFKHIVEEMRLLRPQEFSAPRQSTPPPAPPVEMVVNLGTVSGNREEPLTARPAAYLPQAAAATVEYRVTAGADTSLVAVPALEGMAPAPGTSGTFAAKSEFPHVWQPHSRDAVSTGRHAGSRRHRL